MKKAAFMKNIRHFLYILNRLRNILLLFSAVGLCQLTKVFIFGCGH